MRWAFGVLTAAVFVGSLQASVAGEAIPLRFSQANIHEMTLEEQPAGAVKLTTTGSDPYIFTAALPANAAIEENHVLSFEFFSLSGTDSMQVFLLPPLSENQSIRGDGLSRSEGWSRYSVDLKTLLPKLNDPATGLRLDFGRKAGCDIQIRNFMLRPPSREELEFERRKNALKEKERIQDQQLRGYLDREFPCSITSVLAEKNYIIIQGNIGKEEGTIALMGLPIYADSAEAVPAFLADAIEADDAGNFSIQANRFHPNGTDYLLCRWLIARPAGDRIIPLSHARYTDSIIAKWDLPEETPHNRKGLGGFSPGRPVEDVNDLGCSAVTVNFLLDSLLRTAPGDGRTPYDYAGRTWYVNDSAVANLDKTLLLAAEYDQIVSIIILLNQAHGEKAGAYRKLLAHPDAHPSGIFVMPNLTSEEGVAAYAAGLNYLAERYSRPDKKYGRIHHWIMHNEVNSGWVWTNMGEKSALRYMDAYHKSMRMAHLIARQYNPHAKVFISLEHNWTSTHSTQCYTAKELLDILLEFSKAEGDFEWAVAYHPYPQNLGNPRTWEDHEATFSLDTPKITFKNIEVIDAWARQPRTMYQGKTMRDIQFTEQGPNSPDYSDKSLQEQAAAMAYLWVKLDALDSISMYHFHNWVDNRNEGGLRIGLRRFPDDEEEPLGKKPVWYVFQALDTPEQEQAIDFAKDIIGITDWEAVPYTDPIQ